MTICAPAVQFNTAEMSVVPRNLARGKEVNYMTTATAFESLLDPSEASGIRPHGIDRTVQRLAIAMLTWSRTRAERNAETHQERTLRLQETNAVLQREADALRLTQRIGF